MADVPRLLPDEPFPPYTYIPGVSPHPHSDPAGHSFGKTVATAVPPDPQRWWDCRPYLHGLDLFNHGFYWEAHEQFEAIWLACGRRGPVADFLKGLIKLAAAGVKYLAGKSEGVRSHTRRAAALFRSLGGEAMLGLPLGALQSLAEELQQSGWQNEAPQLWPR
jgi:hypothetical protein